MNRVIQLLEPSSAWRNAARMARLLPAMMLAFLAAPPASAAEPLAVLEYRVTGTRLTVTPSVLSVPKGIAGSILPEVQAGGSSQTAAAAELTDGAHVEAILRGPSFEARRLVGAPNQPLLLPPLNLVGDYQLDQIRLVDSSSGEVRLEGVPSSIPVRVFDEVLVSRVTSRPLTLEEIQEKGIVIDERNFRAVEFEVGFVLDGKTIPVTFPVVAPRFEQSTEIIPEAELNEKLAEAALINQRISATAQLPPELEQSRLNIQVQGINFQRVRVGEQELELQIPPIPALMVIPGNIGFLNQFFSVQIFTENAAPAGSGLSVHNLKAELILPPGQDQVPAASYSEPGDDPLRMARVGPEEIIEDVQRIVRPGPDQQPGTADDIGRLFPGESGQAEFLVEGLREGLHVMDLTLTADLDGLAAGTVQIKGKAAGSVLVRNPRFSMAFTHPRTVRAGEPYEASVTILNTGITPANLVSVTLSENSISGGILESPATVELGTILPGETATAVYRVRAQRTGAVSFSNLTTSDDSLVGRFRLRMGIDERGVALSPDTFAMPDFANELPETVLRAAIRVLGQGLSVATAGQVPAGVKRVSRGAVTTRLLELAEAGQRIRYGDALERVLTDLLLDWQGARLHDDGFQQIVLETEAGREWREAIFDAIQAADPSGATGTLLGRAADLAGRGEAWAVFSLDAESGTVRFGDGVQGRIPSDGGGKVAAAYRRSDETKGAWLVARPSTNLVLEWNLTNAIDAAELALVITKTNGTATQLAWTVADLPVGGCVGYDAARGGELSIDADCNGTPESFLPARRTVVNELPPEVIGVFQDTSVLAGRPRIPCDLPEMRNYGTILAVLFSKPMTQATVSVPEAYRLDNGNTAGSVRIQPGGRVALLNMRQGVSAIRPREMRVSGITDPRGNAVTETPVPVTTDLRAGVAIQGRVVRSDGTPAAGVPVTLTMYDEASTLFGCDPLVVRVSQVFTDEEGAFDLDFIMAGIPYSVSATDTAGLSPEALEIILESAGGGQIAREKLMELASRPSARDTLLEQFAVGSLPQAIAKAEGLDRALLRDTVLPGSPREGSVVPVALRFRGRGTVAGQILASNGATPVPGAAVNLYPDPDSRELGRGIFSDPQGRFAFTGVPLGIFSVKVETGTRQFRTVSGLLEHPGQVTNVTIVLSGAPSATTELRGRVVEADQETPHPNARVFVGRFRGSRLEDVVAAVTAGGDGFWSAPGLPVRTYDVVAVSHDGKRRGERREIATVNNGLVHLNIPLQDVVTVFGRVETSTGQAVANALVAGGEALVRTDANGFFTLTGVPSGHRVISAGLERDPEAGIDFPRLGSTAAEIIPGIQNFVVVRLRAAGRIAGRVLDAAGNPVPNVRVVIPEDNGFMWVEANEQGEYEFENLALKEYTLSAPGPAAIATDTSGLVETIRQGNEAELMAAIGEAFEIFTGASDPFLTGENDDFNPLTWGFTRTRLSFDGQTAVADIRFLRQGTVSGVVRNGQGVPIGARVRLTGMGPLPNGQPTMVIRAERNSDPATGVFVFENQLLAGPWGLQAASPFYPLVITAEGATSSTDPDATNIVLQFPETREVNGRLMGNVLLPDGSPAGEGVNVKISFGDDFIIRTDTNGFFDTQIALPAGGYHVEADDPLTGLVGDASVNVRAGLTNSVTVQLLGRGDLLVEVVQAGGMPAPGAAVRLEQGTYPREVFEGAADAEGRLLFRNLFEGRFAVNADFISGPVRISGRSAISVPRGRTNTVTVQLQATGTIQGRFVKRDGVTPVPFAQVAVGNIGFAATDSEGAFTVEDIPLGSYRLTASDPVTGAGARLNVALSVNGEVKEVLLVEQPRGEVNGVVIGSYGTNFVSGATVTLETAEGLIPKQTVTTGPDGRFQFAGIPAGSFTLEAVHPLSGLRWSRAGELPLDAPSVTLNIPLRPLGSIAARVLLPDGELPAANAVVKLLSTQGRLLRESDTDAGGAVLFVDLTLGDYLLRAESLAPNETRSVDQIRVSVSEAGSVTESALTLRGVGEVSGTVFLSDGTTPAAGAEVNLENLAELVRGERDTVLADAEGRFRFQNAAAGPFRVSAVFQALGGSVNGEIDLPGQQREIEITLGGRGSVIGRLVRADGVSSAPGIDVLLTFPSQSGLPGRAAARTGPDGAFELRNIPVGPFTLEAIAAEFSGIARARSEIEINGEVLDLGPVPLDEEDPAVAAVFPAHTAVRIPTTISVELTFTEALLLESVSTNGIYIRSAQGTIPSELLILEDTNGIPRRVRLIPFDPLASEETYEVVVLDGERRSPTGELIAAGPRDRVGRPLPAPFLSTFTTADDDPPVVVSIFPSDEAVQIDPRAVLRLTFNEPIRPEGIEFTLTGPAGPVAGNASAGLDGLVLAFAPVAPLQVNASYTASVNGIQDLAGNPADNLPISATFQTLDTLGPEIAEIRIAGGARPLAGTVIPVEAIFREAESNVTVRFTRDLVPAGTAMNEPFTASIQLPTSGSAIVRAIASDQYNNDGPLAELTIQIVSNQPPAIEFVRVTPLSGPVPSGGFVAVDVIASDDSGIASLRAIASGALTSDLQGTNSTRLRVQGTVSSNAAPGEKILIFAEATDDTGNSSGEQTFSIEVSDGTDPFIEILQPEPNTTLPPGPLEMAVRARDNSTNLNLRLELSGALSLTQTVSLAIAPGTNVTNIFTVPLDGAPRDGSFLNATVVATDTAGHSASVSASFRLPDLGVPEVVSISPPSGEVDVALFPTISVRFNEPVTNVTDATFQILLEDAPVGGTLAFSETNQVIQWTPAEPLIPGAGYLLRLSGEITDPSGNPAAPLDSSFTVTGFQITSPQPVADVVEGQLLEVAAAGANTNGVEGVLFRVADGAPAVALAGAGYQTQVTVPSIAEPGGSSTLLLAHALVPAPGPNLVQNPGNDEPLSDGEITGWEEAAGSGWTQRPGDPDPESGSAYFFAGNVSQAELRQDIDISAFAQEIAAGEQFFAFTGFVRSGGGGGSSQIILEFRGGEENGILASFDSGMITVQDSWREVFVFQAAPLGTEIIRVRLLSARNAGSASDGYFDTLSLRPVFNAPLEPVALRVFPAGEDTDADGVPNGIEAAVGSDPFNPDASADSDGDGLSNLEEVGLGTNAGKPDTDDDFLPDGEELALGADPLNPDTDGDSVLDGLDSTPVSSSAPPTLTTAPLIETVEGVATNLIVRAEDGDGNLSRLVASFSGSQPGLRAEFHSLGRSIGVLADIDFSAVPARVDSVPNIDFNSEPFWSGGPLDQFAARFSGLIRIPQAGTYTFFTTSDDGSQLLVDGKVIVNNDGTHSAGERSGEVSLEAGLHSFEVRFFENGGGAMLRASWQGPGIAKEAIPASAFIVPAVFWESGSDTLYAQLLAGFNAARAGESALESGARFAAFRDLLPARFPAAEIHSASFLTERMLQQPDFLVLSSQARSGSAISPLSAAEQDFLPRYIENGGAAVLLAGSSDFESANESLLDPFGADAAGKSAPDEPVVITADPASPITSGSHGVITGFEPGEAGWFDALPESAVVLGRLQSNNEPALALIPAGALAPGSGLVLLATTGILPPEIILNAMAAAGLSSRINQLTAALEIAPLPVGTNLIEIIALDGDALSATNQITVVTLPDSDGDGLPDRDDNDGDGDGLSDDEELLAGTDPAIPDSDGDSILDGADARPLRNNAPPVAGLPRRNLALEFDGAGDFVAFHDRNLISPTAGAIEFYFTAAEGTNIHHLFYAGDDGDGFGGQTEFHLNLDGQILQWILFAGEERWRLESHELEAGRLYHAAAVWDSAAGVVRLYLDGALIDAGQYHPIAPSAWSNELRAGRHLNTAPGRAYAGVMDELRIWNSARTQLEIRQGMSRALSGFEPGLAGYWPMDEGSGDRVYSQASAAVAGIPGKGASDAAPRWVESPARIVSDQPVTVLADSSIAIALPGFDGDDDPLTAEIQSLPAGGRIFQSPDGISKAAEITAVPAPVLNPDRVVIYEPLPGYHGADSFAYTVSDSQEVSAPALARIHVRPAGAPPVAADDTRFGFEDTPLLLDDLLANDSDPDGAELALAAFSQPARGTLSRNEDGTLTYLPEAGFSGTDRFTYIIADELAWNRRADFVPGTLQNSSLGNPSLDAFGFPVWGAHFVRGGPLGSSGPWYAAPAAPLVWDGSWFGGNGLWARGDNVNPPISSGALTHNIGSTELLDHIPLVSWTSPFDQFEIELAGNLRVQWSGSGSVGSPVEVDVAIALRRASSGMTEPLYTNTVSKPSPGDSIGDFVLLPVHLENIVLDAGDQILVTHRARNTIGSRWINLPDGLFILPAASSRAAEVMLNIGANQTPVASAPTPGSALAFDGANDVVEFGNPPALQITGSQTIEFWIQPANFSERQNPIAKAYGGEGTLTIETDGRINYYYGITGGNSGASQVEYQGFSTGRSIPLNQWTHAAIVRDLEAMRLRWYINGRLVNETEAIFAEAVAGSNPFCLGRGYVRNFAGILDEVRIWNTARTSAEIQAGLFARMSGDEPGLAAYWNLDEGAGTTAADLTTGGSSGTFGAGDSQPAWVSSFAPFDQALAASEDAPLALALTGTDADGEPLTARVTQLPAGRLFQTEDGAAPSVPLASEARSALAFDGLDDYVLIGTDPALEMTSALSIAAWVKPERPAASPPVASVFLNKEGEYEIGLETDGTIWWAIANGSPGWVQVNTGWKAPFGEWTHIALVFDEASVVTYANGIEVHRSEASGVIGDAHPAEDELRIGGRQIPFNPFHGQLDEVSLWNAALSPEAVRALVHVPLTGAEPGLVAWWRFNEGSGTAVADSASGGRFGGTLGGSLEEQPVWAASTAPVFPEFPPTVAHPGGRLIYLSRTNAAGIDFLSFTLLDGKVESPAAVIPIRVAPVNDAPAASPDAAFTVADFAITTPSVLLNDFDAENDSLSILDFTQPASGSVTTNGPGTFLYEPAAGFEGIDSFTYRATDGIGASEPALVTIQVSSRGEFRWANPSGGDWSDPANWSQGAVPGPEDSAVIDLEGDYEITVDSDAVAGRLILDAPSGSQRLVLASRTLELREAGFIGTNAVFEMTGGALRGPGALSIAGTLAWSGGNMAGQGITEILPGASAEFTGGTKGLDATRLFVNRGTIIWSQGAIDLNSGSSGGSARFENAPGGLIEIRHDGRIMASGFGDVNSPPPRFLNAGTLHKTASGGDFLVDVPFENRGRLEIHEGSIRLREDSLFTGAIEIAGGAAFFPETCVFGPVSIEGEGAFTSDTGVQTFRDPVSIPFLELAGGTIAGPASLTITAALDWTSGTMRGPGRTIIPAGVTAVLSGSSTKGLDARRVLENRGTIEWSGGSIDLNAGSSGGSARIENHPSATFEILHDGRIHSSGFGDVNSPPPEFLNQGAFLKSGGSGEFLMDVPFESTGPIQIASGSLRLREGAAMAGIVEFAEGTVFAPEDASFQDIRFDGPGIILLDSGTQTFASDTVISRLRLANGVLTGPGTVTITNSLAWTGGIMSGPGRVVLAEGAEAGLSGSGTKGLDAERVFENRGVVRWTEGSIDLNARSSGGSGVFENSVLGAIEVLHDARILASGFGDLNSPPPLFANAGTIIRSEGTETFRIDVPLDNTGVLKIDSGTVRTGAGGGSSGTILVAAGTVFAPETFTFRAKGALFGDGTWLFDTGTQTFAAPHEVAVLSFQNGLITGEADLTISRNFEWTGGTMAGPGRILIASGAQAALSGGGTKGIDGTRVLRNEGTLVWSGGSIDLNASSSSGSGRIENASGATFDLQHDGRILASGFGDRNNPAPRFDNSGEFTKSAGSDSATIGVPFNNGGIVRADSGTLLFESAGTHSGSFHAGTGAALNFNRGTHAFEPGAAFSGTGSLRFGSPITLAADLSFGDLTVTFEGGASVSGAFRLSIDSGGTLLFNKSMTIPGGITAAGALRTANAGINLAIGGNLTLTASGVIDNPGTIQAAEFINNGGSILGNAPTVLDGGVLSIQAILLGAESPGPLGAAAVHGSPVTLLWRAQPGQRFIVEAAPDLRAWSPAPAEIREIAPGQYRATLPSPGPKHRFFRLRWAR